MFQKKPIYIIGTILFTFILLADLALFFLIPGGLGRNGMGSFGGGMPGDFSSGSSGFDTLDGSSDTSGFGGFGGGFKDKGSLSGMQPQGEKGDFTLPEGMEKPEDPGQFEGMEAPDEAGRPEGMELPESFDASLAPGRDQLRGGMAVFSVIRRIFWPVLAVCVLGDGLCIFMLMRISRRKKAAAPANSSAADEYRKTNY